MSGPLEASGEEGARGLPETEVPRSVTWLRGELSIVPVEDDRGHVHGAALVDEAGHELWRVTRAAERFDPDAAFRALDADRARLNGYLRRVTEALATETPRRRDIRVLPTPAWRPGAPEKWAAGLLAAGALLPAGITLPVAGLSVFLSLNLSLMGADLALRGRGVAFGRRPWGLAAVSLPAFALGLSIFFAFPPHDPASPLTRGGPLWWAGLLTLGTFGAAVGLTVRAVREGLFVRPPVPRAWLVRTPEGRPDDARPAGLARVTYADGLERLSLVARTDDPGFCVVAPLDRIDLDAREIPRMARMALGHALWKRRMAERSDAARERLRALEASRRAVEIEDEG